MKSDCYKWPTATCMVEPWCVPQNVIAKLPNPSFEAVPLLDIIAIIIGIVTIIITIVTIIIIVIIVIIFVCGKI